MPAGKQAVTASSAVLPVGQQPRHRRHQVHDVAVALDVAVVLDAHGARLADPAQVVAAEVDQHQVLGAFLLVRQQLLLEQQVLFLGLRRATACPRSDASSPGRP